MPEAQVIKPDFFNARNPYKTAKADAARDDARKRLPEHYAHRAAIAIGGVAPNHNILTLAAAFAYADAGLNVVDSHALDRNGVGTGPGGQTKVPRGACWQERATTNLDDIESFWAGDGEYPADKHGESYSYARPDVFRNVSAAFPKGCGLFVLDIDGDAGLDALDALEKEHGELPQTWESVTGSGGVHLIFRASDLDIRNTASSIAPGVDIRGANGQIIVPPSVHPSGNFYRWEDGCAPWECEVADAPEWLCQLALNATKGRGEGKKKTKKKKSAKKKNQPASAGKRRQSFDAHSIDEHLDAIGDGDGRKGFNGPINSAFCAFFAKEGVDADASEFMELVLNTILDAPCEDDRAERRYATSGYLNQALEDAREYIAAQEPYSPTTEAIAELIETNGINKDSSVKEVREFLSEHLAADAASRQRFTDALGSTSRKAGATVLSPKEIKAIWGELDREHAKAAFEEEATRRKKLPEPNYVALEDATVESVMEAASAATWLPSGWCERDGWFGYIDFETEKFKPVCRAFEVVAFADGISGSTRTNQITIRYVHRSMGVVESEYRVGDTYSESGLLGRLANEGLGLHPDAKAAAKLTLLRSVSSNREAVYHAQSGWDEGREVYMSPTGQAVTRPDDKRIHILDKTMRVSNAKSGTVEEFRECAETALKGRAAEHFLPGFLTGPAGCAANFLGVELSPVVRNEGKARHGKTTALKAGVAWFAIPTKEGLLFSANTTWTALEVLAVKGTGAALAPDDEGTADKTPEEEQRMALQYASGVGKLRGTPEGGLRDVRGWTGSLGQSTEHRLDHRLEAAQAKDDSFDIKSGAMSRIVTVNYDSVVTLRRSPPPEKRGADYKAEDFDDAELDAYDALAHDAKGGGGIYAVAGPAYAKALLELGVDEVRERHAALVSEWTGDHSGAAMRVVETLALFGVTAKIAQEAELLPDDVDLIGMLRKTMETTIAERSHHLDTERQALNKLRVGVLDGLNSGLVRLVGDGSDNWRGANAYYRDGKLSEANKNRIKEMEKDESIGRDEIDEYRENAILCSRVYFIPTRNVSKFVKEELSALIDDLRGKGLVLPKGETDKKRGIWRDTPGEGRVDCVRIEGTFFHGEVEGL